MSTSRIDSLVLPEHDRRVRETQRSGGRYEFDVLWGDDISYYPARDGNLRLIGASDLDLAAIALSAALAGYSVVYGGPYHQYLAGVVDLSMPLRRHQKFFMRAALEWARSTERERVEIVVANVRKEPDWSGAPSFGAYIVHPIPARAARTVVDRRTTTWDFVRSTLSTVSVSRDQSCAVSNSWEADLAGGRFIRNEGELAAASGEATLLIDLSEQFSFPRAAR